MVLAMSGLAPATTATCSLSTLPPETSTFAKLRPSGTCESLFGFLRRHFLVQLHNLQLLRSCVSQFQHFGAVAPFFFTGLILGEGNSRTTDFWGLIRVDPDAAITLANITSRQIRLLRVSYNRNGNNEMACEGTSCLWLAPLVKVSKSNSLRESITYFRKLLNYKLDRFIRLASDSELAETMVTWAWERNLVISHTKSTNHTAVLVVGSVNCWQECGLTPPEDKWGLR